MFRYADRDTAQAALLAAVHLRGISELGPRVAVDAEALAIVGAGVLVYGPEARHWTDVLITAAGALRLSRECAVLHLRTRRLCPWPFEVTTRPSGLDRRGARLAMLANVGQEASGPPVSVAAVVRAGRGDARRAEVLTELVGRCQRPPADARWLVTELARLVNGAIVVGAVRPAPQSIGCTLDVLVGLRR